MTTGLTTWWPRPNLNMRGFTISDSPGVKIILDGRELLFALTVAAQRNIVHDAVQGVMFPWAKQVKPVKKAIRPERGKYVTSSK